jgi:hypothetical protein
MRRLVSRLSSFECKTFSNPKTTPSLHFNPTAVLKTKKEKEMISYNKDKAQFTRWFQQL